MSQSLKNQTLSNSALANLLAFSGAIPFVVPIVLSVLKLDVLGLDYQRIVYTYAAVIASFMSGIYWALALQRDYIMRLFVESNAITLAAWFALLWYSPYSLLIFIACFICLLFIDLRLYRKGFLEIWYIKLRLMLTAIVVVSLFGYFVAQFI